MHYWVHLRYRETKFALPSPGVAYLLITLSQSDFSIYELANSVLALMLTHTSLSYPERDNINWIQKSIHYYEAKAVIKKCCGWFDHFPKGQSYQPRSGETRLNQNIHNGLWSCLQILALNSAAKVFARWLDVQYVIIS